jgi:hypothetical protein
MLGFGFTLFTVASTESMQWRRERDSNPRYGFPYSGFQDRLFQPLTHPSATQAQSYLATVYNMVFDVIRMIPIGKVEDFISDEEQNPRLARRSSFPDASDEP